MTYNSTISADAPVSWFHLEETGALSTSTAIADAGSAGGTGTAAGTPSRITTGQAGAGTIGGNSMKWDNASSTYLQHAVTFASAADFTMETWYKRDTGYGATVNTGNFLYMNGGNKNCQLAVNNNNIVITQNGSTVINAVPAGVTVMDGSWHHLAVVQSGTTITVYVDGVSKLTYSGANASANTSATWQVGSIGTAQTCWLDEPAFYTKALTSTQVSNHYTVGTATPSTPVTVTPPYIDLGTLTEVAPAFAGGPDVKTLPPVMSLNNLTVPAPVVSESSNATATPPVMTLSASTPVPVVLAPFVNFGITSDRGGAAGSNTATTVQLAYSTYNSTASFEASGFTTAGNAVDTAYLCLYATSAGTTSFAVAQIGAAWDDTTAGDTTKTGPNLTTQLHITAGWNYIDITPIAKNWAAGQPNYGVQLSAYTSGSATFSTRESATNQPYIALSTVAPQVVTATPPVMTASLATADPVVAAGVGALVQPTVASLTADVIAPAVSATTVLNVSTQAPVSAMTLTFPGGIPVNPDFSASATVMTLSISAPNAGVSVQYPVTTQAVYINAGGIYTSAATIDLTTNVLKVAPVMTLKINWPGIYVESADRYMTKVAATVNQYARWFKLNESAGTSVADSAFSGTLGVNPANLVGTIGYQVDGPYLRKAMHFNGVDSYIDSSGGTAAWGNGFNDNTSGQVPHYVWGQVGTTIEFSIRTTATDGTITAGGGAGPSAYSPYTYDSGFEVRLTGGQLYVISGAYVFKVRTTINDGQWHHVIIQGSNGGSQMSYVNVDGQRVLTRDAGMIGAGGGAMLPRSIMAKTTFTGYSSNASAQQTGVTDYLVGDLRDFITRMNNYMSADDAVKVYYEWSNSLIVQPDVISLGAEMPKPFSVKGNVKKMLALYGLPYTWTSGTFSNRPISNYRSPLGGLAIKHFQVNGYGQQVDGTTFDADYASSGGGYSAPGAFFPAKPVPFMQNGYLVYPVDIYGSISRSADGVLNGEYDFTMGSGQLTDDLTGKSRFVNLAEDLVNADDFDVVTIVNYPPEVKFASTNPTVPGGSFSADPIPMQPHVTPEFFTNYNTVEYNLLRDQFRDGLLEAAYSGVSLWIPEFHAAKHLGFIEDYDVHGTYAGPGTLGTRVWLANHPGSSDGSMSDGTKNANNWAAQWLDMRHGNFITGNGSVPVPNDPTKILPDQTADYEPMWQVNQFRRIVATMPGITDIPSWERTDIIQRASYDPWRMSNSHYAFDVMDRTHGLQIGDQVRLSASASPFTSDGQSVYGTIVSGRGKIAGTVISKEMESYWGPYATRVTNPFKDNVLTIAAERGTTVRGRAIRGRAWIELMDNDLTTTSIGIHDPAYLNSLDNVLPGSTWAYDTGRVKAIALQLFNTKFSFKPNASDGTSSEFRATVTTLNYFSFNDDFPLKSLPSVSMQQRGLRWLQEDFTLDANDARVYGPAMEVTVSMADASVVANRELDVQVLGAMRLDLEVRDAKNYRGNDVQEKALPMSLSLEMHGTGAVVTAPAMTLSLTMPGVTLVAHGEKIAVYLEGNSDVTLFLKEDN